VSRPKGKKFVEAGRKVLAVADSLQKQNPELSSKAAIRTAIRIMRPILPLGAGTLDSIAHRIFESLYQPEGLTIPATGRGRPMKATLIPYGAHDAIQECVATGPGEPLPYEPGISLRRNVKSRSKRTLTKYILQVILMHPVGAISN
jgi:hypothetical protein